jgi:hypothetical protein
MRIVLVHDVYAMCKAWVRHGYLMRLPCDCYVYFITNNLIIITLLILSSNLMHLRFKDKILVKTIILFVLFQPCQQLHLLHTILWQFYEVAN